MIVDVDDALQDIEFVTLHLVVWAFLNRVQSEVIPLEAWVTADLQAGLPPSRHSAVVVVVGNEIGQEDLRFGESAIVSSGGATRCAWFAGCSISLLSVVFNHGICCVLDVHSGIFGFGRLWQGWALAGVPADVLGCLLGKDPSSLNLSSRSGH